MEYALMVLAGCSGFTVAGVCYSCNMDSIDFYGNLESFKSSIGMRPSNKSQKADAGRKTKKALNIAMNDLTVYEQALKTMPPGASFSPRVEKRIGMLRDLYTNPDMRTVYTDPSSIKIKKVKNKK
jgi:hypothetical protein